MNDGLIVLLAFLLILMCAIDWIQFRDELEEMKDEEEKQREDDNL